MQAVAALAEAHRAAGSTRAAAKTFESSLAILALFGHDQGSAAARVRGKLAATHVQAGAPEQALKVVEDMLEYAQNVHIAEHMAAMAALERVVDALAAKKQGFKAKRAAEAMLQVRSPAQPRLGTA